MKPRLLFSVLISGLANGLDAVALRGPPKANDPELPSPLGAFWPKSGIADDGALVAPNEKPLMVNFGTSGALPFTFISLVGLSSILNSCSFLGVTGLAAAAAAALPNENGLCETSVPLLLPLGGPKENGDPPTGAVVTGEGPNINGAFFSPPTGGVEGAAPKENGLAAAGLASATGAELGRWPNEKAPADSDPNVGLGASIGVEAPDAG